MFNLILHNFVLSISDTMIANLVNQINFDACFYHNDPGSIAHQSLQTSLARALCPIQTAHFVMDLCFAGACTNLTLTALRQKKPPLRVALLAKIASTNLGGHFAHFDIMARYNSIEYVNYSNAYSLPNSFNSKKSSLDIALVIPNMIKLSVSIRAYSVLAHPCFFGN